HPIGSPTACTKECEDAHCRGQLVAEMLPAVAAPEALRRRLRYVALSDPVGRSYGISVRAVLDCILENGMGLPPVVPPSGQLQHVGMSSGGILGKNVLEFVDYFIGMF